MDALAHENQPAPAGRTIHHRPLLFRGNAGAVSRARP